MSEPSYYIAKPTYIAMLNTEPQVVECPALKAHYKLVTQFMAERGTSLTRRRRRGGYGGYAGTRRIEEVEEREVCQQV